MRVGVRTSPMVPSSFMPTPRDFSYLHNSKLGLGLGLELGLGLGLGLGSGLGLGFGVRGTTVLVPSLAVALERGDLKGLEEVVEENHLLSCEWG